jgi:hypothetical protein
MKSKARSLFKSDVVPAAPIPEPSPDDVRAIFAAVREVHDLEATLRQMEALADTAVAEDRIERAGEYAEKIREKARRVRLHVAEGNADQAALEGVRLAEVWMQLRVDTMFAGPVWEKANRRESASKVSDADIIAAIETHPKQKDAAEYLNMDTRQLRRRLAAIRKRTS